ncbi:BadF/BadG/BcrA/BcrD ATPase family protein [Gracilimonas sp.]|uniref:BadF/BadG/BcrA/BcrD ATPase family protein n=1 Tax=Gracilimonas sp. TaxID=1974203 RepID=UPI0032EB0EC7
MSILIADSGSTKTEWILVNQNGEKEYFHTDGLNPYFMSLEQLTKVINEGLVSALKDKTVDEIFFYGAGCGTERSKGIIRKAISTCFGSATITVDTDLLAAAKACFWDKPGVACILGTGSNSCLYDGEKIINQIPSLGFTLGDEGSGGYFGKRILRSYFYNLMPSDLRKELEKRHDMELDQILQKVYKEPNGNRFVASFSHLLGDFAEHDFIKDIVRSGFEDFAEKQLAYFGDITDKDIGFVGSIAAIHRETLEKVLAKRGLKLGIIVRKPIERLVDNHLGK